MVCGGQETLFHCIPVTQLTIVVTYVLNPAQVTNLVATKCLIYIHSNH
jgi:hypothetical protein